MHKHTHTNNRSIWWVWAPDGLQIHTYTHIYTTHTHSRTQVWVPDYMPPSAPGGVRISDAELSRVSSIAAAAATAPGVCMAASLDKLLAWLAHSCDMHICWLLLLLQRRQICVWWRV